VHPFSSLVAPLVHLFISLAQTELLVALPADPDQSIAYIPIYSRLPFYISQPWLTQLAQEELQYHIGGYPNPSVLARLEWGTPSESAWTISTNSWPVNNFPHSISKTIILSMRTKCGAEMRGRDTRSGKVID
jgi:hypothetical protein